MFRVSILLLMFSLATGSAFSQQDQSNCSQVLKRAQSTFEQGRIDEVPKMVEACLASGFTKEERIAAYKLLTLTYLYQNERELAESSIIKFLKLNPEYEINPALDPNEFITLYNSIRTRPVLLYGAIAGVNFSYVNVHRNFSLDNSAVKRGTYNSRPGIQAGLAFEYLFSKSWSLSPEIHFATKSFHFKDTILGFSHLHYEEDQAMIDLPLFIRKNFLLNNRTLLPYVEAGIIGHGLVRARASIERQDHIGPSRQDVPERSIPRLNQRNILNYSLGIGAGIKIKNVIGNGYLMISARYQFGMRTMVDPMTRFNNEELIYNYLYLENDYKLNTMSFSLAYLLPHYKPKKMY
ncbi:MAG: porin family protein [Cytophagaceae bacterium]